MTIFCVFILTNFNCICLWKFQNRNSQWVVLSHNSPSAATAKSWRLRPLLVAVRSLYAVRSIYCSEPYTLLHHKNIAFPPWYLIFSNLCNINIVFILILEVLHLIQSHFRCFKVQKTIFIGVEMWKILQWSLLRF